MHAPSLSGSAASAHRLRAWRRAVMSAAAALVVSGGVSAVDGVRFYVDRIDGEGWRARGVDAVLALDAGATSAQLRIARLDLPGLTQPLRDVQVECPQLAIEVEAFGCSRALIRAASLKSSSQTIRASIRYGRRDGALDVALPELRLVHGAASAKMSLRKDAWSATVQLAKASIPALSELARELGVSPPFTATSGEVTLSAHIRGVGGAIHQASIEGQLARLGFNNDSGSLASDALALDFRGALRRVGAGSKFGVELRSSQGQGYAQPIFLDFGVHGGALTATGTIDGSSVTVDRFTLDHTNVAKLNGSAQLNFTEPQPLRRLDAHIDSIQFPGAYESYLQPLLLDTSFKAMQTSGSLSGRVVFDAGAPQSIELGIKDLTFEDAQARFGLTSLNGQWNWRDAAQPDDEVDEPTPTELTSKLRWNGGVLLGLSIGAADLKFSTSGRQLRLLQPARIPLLDGAIDFETLRVRNVGTPKVAFLVDATIQPISVDRLCRAFGWPEFGGRVGGAISKLRLREGVMTLGATLHAQVFDGAVRISELRLDEPFGQWPRFYSSIALEALDLELVTRAFSFGRITGRLSGDIRELELFNWTPVAFNARFYTPPGDRSRHRISQRAVENIGSIGGSGAGVSAALSSGFLRFFDDFNYERLGLSCRLENDVCHMNGVAPAPNGGYYLVKGEGVPRIDVIGNSRRVDWPRLVQQLIAVTQSEGPVVR